MTDGTEKAAVGSRGCGYGLDAELERKKAATYDYYAEDEAREWLRSLTGEDVEGDFSVALKDGKVICKTLNAIKSGTIQRINNSQMPFKQMENISSFLKACRTLGVAEHSLFETVDLYEAKDIGLVVRCLFALGSTVQLTVPEFEGPHLGARLNKTNKREFTPDQVARARINAAMPSRQTAGSAGIMERTEVRKTGITVAAEYSGPGCTGAPVKWSQGSAGIMQRSEVTKTGITMGAEYAGQPLDAYTIPKASRSCHDVLKQNEAASSPTRSPGISLGESASSGDGNDHSNTAQKQSIHEETN